MRFSSRPARLAAPWLVCATLTLFAGGPLHAAPDAVTVDGGAYAGPLRDGKLHGKGRIDWPNGAWYEGEFDKGLYQGKGVLVGATGWRYEGDFVQGRLEGQGRLALEDGTVYQGAFRNDLFNGRGRYSRPDGEVYEGEFKDDKYHGEGRLDTAEGRIYIGRFEAGEPVGRVRLISGDSRYEGEIADWQPNGPGRFTDGQETVYEGVFVDGALQGKGKVAGKDGRFYEGDFENWRFHGQGVYRNESGDEYRGAFAYGLFEGEGTLVYAKPQADGRTRDSGTWRRGRLFDGEAEARYQRELEAALYAQPALLDGALQALQAQDPARIDLYLLAVAGDGRQEVFRREVAFVRQQFDRDFGTAGRSLALVNSRTGLDATPLATHTSLRRALKAVAERMDVEQDILFLFLTSHGSKDHELTFKLNGVDLPDLPAATLGEMLRDSGIRWKVVVVSACYSGGFVDAIKDEGTLVMTAARHDRASFGCADDNDFTYFGRAYFKESLSPKVSFIEAFDKAREKVEAWETEQFAEAAGDEEAGSEADEADEGGEGGESEHSLPVIDAPAPIVEQLQRWRAQTGQR